MLFRSTVSFVIVVVARVEVPVTVKVLVATIVAAERLEVEALFRVD